MSDNFYEQLDRLPYLLSNHLMLTVIALSVGVLVSVPLAVWLTRRRKLQYPVLTVAGVIQTIPSLALLALMVPVLGALAYGLGWLALTLSGQEIPEAARQVALFSSIGFWPAIIALTLYSILPILRNTVTGIQGVDPAMVEAARGMGMTGGQMLRQVELPLSAPVIIAGIRTATVWVVGIATLSTPVGQPSLGDYIFTGLTTGNTLMILFGVVGASTLAILLDLLIGGLERAADERRRGLGLFSLIVLGVVVVVGLVAPQTVGWIRGAPAGPTIHVGAKDFGEQRILGHLLVETLESEGIATRYTEGMGTTIVFDALVAGDVDLYVEYTGTVWTTFMGRDEPLPPDELIEEMSEWLVEEHGVRTLGALGFENAYALAMRRDRAEALGIQTMRDLAGHAPDMRIAGSYEFFGRPEWRQIRDAYRLDFRERVTMDPALMYGAVAGGEVDVISAFSTDGRIDAFDLVVLNDPAHAIPPYDAVILLGPAVAHRADVVEAMEPLLGAIDAMLMRQANHTVDRDRQPLTIRRAARRLGEEIGVLR